MNGKVYLLCDPSTNLYKIGMTKSAVDKRIKELQTGNSYEIHLVKDFETSIPSYIEMSLHRHFLNKQSLNEWYELTLQDINEFEDTCQHYQDVAQALQNNPFFKYKIQ
jgi:cell wall assembly regulator SMI1